MYSMIVLGDHEGPDLDLLPNPQKTRQNKIRQEIIKPKTKQKTKTKQNNQGDVRRINK